MNREIAMTEIYAPKIPAIRKQENARIHSKFALRMIIIARGTTAIQIQGNANVNAIGQYAIQQAYLLGNQKLRQHQKSIRLRAYPAAVNDPCGDICS